ncbi:syntaxin-17-like [Limulus polyphemus]|uniref:Syntaxin-17-like n=1 Tax=Limulus polyphemus TaxID=6850 RepID=A0ABM1SYJ0_LIMPO|nr:syntaxin-17-like [Limulus polyphemus]XP_013780813.1 syntaxin-17-like [Limulus polyphemus]XP_022248696.1 syntaxin-17-like [Limulus polyphemus]XP_022248697.1 syntaxin-17-like [Limulus polyphemus]
MFQDQKMRSCSEKERAFSESDTSEFVRKQPLRRLEIALKRITKIAIPLHLDLLLKHKINIEQFQDLGLWQQVHIEQVNASRTVQQLKSDINELETLGQQVCIEDYAEFEKRVRDVREEAFTAVTSFIEIHSEVTQPCTQFSLDVDPSAAEESISKRSPTPPVVPFFANSLSTNETDKVSNQSHDACVASVDESPEVVKTQLQRKNEQPVNSIAIRSWDILKKELLELNSLIHHFAALVTIQQKPIDNIENNLYKADENVCEGTKHLGMAAALRASMFPVTGALVGGIVGGPLGLMAGFKLAGVAAAVGGGVLGFTSGKFIQRRSEKTRDLELKELSQRGVKGSVSLPDLNSAIESETASNTEK